ncbi:MAG: radical SAM protein, partial [Spirochaetales bacterium]|nr:radical SAM protein [Spirochaetales bacterium]
MVRKPRLNTNYSVVRKVFLKNPRLASSLAHSFMEHIKAGRFDYLRPSGKTGSLGLLYMRITPLCNLNCLTCGQRGVKGVLKGTYAVEEAKKIPPLEVYRKFIDEVSVKKPVYYIWGGEPFMYPHLMEVAQHILHRGSVLAVNTNGTLLARHAEQIVRDKWSALFVSLDSFEEENDRIRGKGSYRRVVEGLEALKREKERQKSSLPYVGIVSVVSNLNYRGLDKLVEAMGDKGLSWHIINLGTYTNDSIVEEHRAFMKEN